MKLDKLFQSLLLTGAVAVVINAPAIAKEVQEDKSSDEDVAVTDREFAKSALGVATAKSPILAADNTKPQLQDSQIANSLEVTKNIIQLSEIELPATSAQMLVQTPTTPSNLEQKTGDQVVPIIGVKANPTAKGVEVILETTLGQQLQITNRSTDNSFIADVSGGQLRLPSGDTYTFRSQNPVTGITEITVINLDANTVRVTVVGEKALPTVELFDDDAGLVFGVNSAATAMQPPQTPPSTTETLQQQPAAQADEPIELVVTGEQDGYRVQNATTATRTDTPLRDIPQSIQVVPRQVLEDRKVRTVIQAVETVSGVSSGGTLFNAPGGSYVQ